MDGYLYNLDPYRQASAGYYAPRYAPSYALDRRSLYDLPPASDSYARIPIDPYAGYGAPPSYQPRPRPRYASPPSSTAFRSRPRPGGPKRKPPPPQNLGPKKKPFKQTQKVRFSEEKQHPSKEKEHPSKKASQKKPLPASPRAQKPDGKAKSQTASLAKETQELHSLYRTGVDPNTGKKFEGIAGKTGEGKKRKAETQAQKSTPVKEAEGSAKKKQRGKKNKKDRRSKKPEASTPVAEKAEPYTMTEEEKKESESALELQRELCERVCEFLGVPPVLEKPETKEEAPVTESDAKPDDSKETEKPSKPEEPERTPEEENEADEKSFEYFSKLFEENQDLRKLYVDNCNSGSFECLVCYSTDAKSSKQFWNLVSLVMHTKMRKLKRPEHRGYGRAVSAVLGWDHLNTPKVPRSHRNTPAADKPKEQVKEEKEPETDGKTADIEEKVADVNATEEHQEEKAAEAKDSIEE